MATIINAGGGYNSTLLASLTNIPTTATAVSGTENWKKYDAIYFEILLSSGTNYYFTSVIFTSMITKGIEYLPTDTPAESNLSVTYRDTGMTIKAWNSAGTDYYITSVKIYGINF